MNVFKGKLNYNFQIVDNGFSITTWLASLENVTLRVYFKIYQWTRPGHIKTSHLIVPQ